MKREYAHMNETVKRLGQKLIIRLGSWILERGIEFGGVIVFAATYFSGLSYFEDGKLAFPERDVVPHLVLFVVYMGFRFYLWNGYIISTVVFGFVFRSSSPVIHGAVMGIACLLHWILLGIADGSYSDEITISDAFTVAIVILLSFWVAALNFVSTRLIDAIFAKQQDHAG
mgnify:CR=1 FL=1